MTLSLENGQPPALCTGMQQSFPPTSATTWQLWDLVANLLCAMYVLQVVIALILAICDLQFVICNS